MKAVNQSIGRSIRHAQDYACIVLVDQRYHRASVQSKLPRWISSQLVACDTFGAAFSSVRKVRPQSKVIIVHAQHTCKYVYNDLLSIVVHVRKITTIFNKETGRAWTTYNIHRRNIYIDQVLKSTQ